MRTSIDRAAQLFAAAALFLPLVVLSVPAPQSESESDVTPESAPAAYSSYGRCRGGTRKVPRLATVCVYLSISSSSCGSSIYPSVLALLCLSSTHNHLSSRVGVHQSLFHISLNDKFHFCTLLHPPLTLTPRSRPLTYLPNVPPQSQVDQESGIQHPIIRALPQPSAPPLTTPQLHPLIHSLHMPFLPTHLIANKLFQFDDLPSEDFPRTQVPIPYQSLAIDKFFVEESNGFLIAQSGTQYAISYDYTLPREFRVPATNPDGSPSPVRSFDLKSFWYGCSQGVPQPECYVRVTGVRARPKRGQEKEVSLQVSYPRLEPPVDPATLTLAKVSFDLTDAWEGLERVYVNVTYDPEGTQPALYAGFVVDSLEYVTNECRRGY